MALSEVLEASLTSVVHHVIDVDNVVTLLVVA
jgi:hypothetical protein